jgi:hypothetical protein
VKVIVGFVAELGSASVLGEGAGNDDNSPGGTIKEELALTAVV